MPFILCLSASEPCTGGQGYPGDASSLERTFPKISAWYPAQGVYKMVSHDLNRTLRAAVVILEIPQEANFCRLTENPLAPPFS